MRWTEESVKLLMIISLYHKHEHKFANVNYKNKSVWEEIVKGMKEKNNHPTSTQCSNKWKQLKKSFVEVEDNKKATRRGTKTCKYYQELHVETILGFRPGVNPLATTSSSGKGEIKQNTPNTGKDQHGRRYRIGNRNTRDCCLVCEIVYESWRVL